jgi:hypothetical protein
MVIINETIVDPEIAVVLSMAHEGNNGGAPSDSIDLPEAERRLEIERRIKQLSEPEQMLVRMEMAQRAQELKDLEEEKKQELVRQALGKFGFFMHMTALLTGCAYLVLLGIFVPKAMPWIFIPIGLWCAGFAYHGWRAWHPKPPGEKAAKKAFEELDERGGGEQQ